MEAAKRASMSSRGTSVENSGTMSIFQSEVIMLSPGSSSLGRIASASIVYVLSGMFVTFQTKFTISEFPASRLLTDCVSMYVESYLMVTSKVSVKLPWFATVTLIFTIR